MVILKAISGQPGSAHGELDLIKNDKDIREKGLKKKARKWREIGLVDKIISYGHE